MCKCSIQFMCWFFITLVTTDLTIHTKNKRFRFRVQKPFIDWSILSFCLCEVMSSSYTLKSKEYIISWINKNKTKYPTEKCHFMIKGTGIGWYRANVCAISKNYKCYCFSVVYAVVFAEFLMVQFQYSYTIMVTV